ncbi:MAG: hypothetical protein ACP5O5_03600 [Fervidicoccaceae archaeon]
MEWRYGSEDMRNTFSCRYIIEHIYHSRGCSDGCLEALEWCRGAEGFSQAMRRDL